MARFRAEVENDQGKKVSRLGNRCMGVELAGWRTKVGTTSHPLGNGKDGFSVTANGTEVARIMEQEDGTIEVFVKGNSFTITPLRRE